MHFRSNVQKRLRKKKPGIRILNLKKAWWVLPREKDRILEYCEKGSCLWPPSPAQSTKPNSKERKLWETRIVLASTTDVMYSLSLTPQKPHSLSLSLSDSLSHVSVVCHLICTLQNHFSLKKCFFLWSILAPDMIWVMGVWFVFAISE